MELQTSPEAELYLDLLAKSLTASLYDESGWVPADRLEVDGRELKLPPGLTVVQEKPFNAREREEGRDWPLFAYTLVGHKRLANVRRCVEQVLKDDIPGDLFEAGVWRGGCAIYMRALLKILGVKDRTVWLADSFQGMPRLGPVDQKITTQRDLHGVSYLQCSLESVQANFARFGLFDERVRFVKGWFNESLPTAAVGRIALLRLDADLYHSTRDAIVSLYDKVSPGGFIVVDDYYGWDGCRKAIDEFRGERGIASPMIPIDWTGAYWRVERATG